MKIRSRRRRRRSLCCQMLPEPSGYRQIADTQFAIKEVCRVMANPTVGHWRQWKRLGRYLRGRPRAVTKFLFQNRLCQIDGLSDSDWAGCRRTARSTSGGATMFGHHLLKSWSATQLLCHQQRRNWWQQWGPAVRALEWWHQCQRQHFRGLVRSN